MLRLERDAWSMVKRLRQATDEYPPPPRLRQHPRPPPFTASAARQSAPGDGDDGRAVPLGGSDAGAGLHGVAARAPAAGGGECQDGAAGTCAHVPGDPSLKPEK